MKNLLFLLASTLIFAAFSLQAAPPGYYELRIYNVASNKLDAVLERFRHTVDPVRRKHGMATAGYWTASITNKEKFIYLMAAPSAAELKKQEREFRADPDFKAGSTASNQKHGQTVESIVVIPLIAHPEATFDFTASQKPRAFELRLYSLLPGKLEAFRHRWRDHAVPIYARHGLKSIGWWIREKKDAEGHDVFVCLLAGDDVSSLQKSIAAFHQDAEWLRIEKESERTGPLRSSVTAYRLAPTDFSALK